MCDGSTDVCSSELALPAYQDYTIRAKMSEVILGMSACRTSITEVYQSGSSAPGANNWGCEVSAGRSEERRVGKESRARGSVNDEKKSISTAVGGGHVECTSLT